jgi:hypothetical protein
MCALLVVPSLLTRARSSCPMPAFPDVCLFALFSTITPMYVRSTGFGWRHVPGSLGATGRRRVASHRATRAAAATTTTRRRTPDSQRRQYRPLSRHATTIEGSRRGTAASTGRANSRRGTAASTGRAITATALRAVVARPLGTAARRTRTPVRGTAQHL